LRKGGAQRKDRYKGVGKGNIEGLRKKLLLLRGAPRRKGRNRKRIKRLNSF